jgi:hypothetical protein
MKNCLLLFVFMLLASCSSESPETSSKKTLQGKWEWTGSSGGIAGTTSTPASTNQNIYIEFSDTTYKTYINGKLSSEKPYTIKIQESIFGDKRPMIVSTDPQKYFVAMSFEIKENTLFLSEECYDCFGSGYVRLK